MKRYSWKKEWKKISQIKLFGKSLTLRGEQIRILVNKLRENLSTSFFKTSSKILTPFGISPPRWRTGNTFSRIARLVFERQQTKKALGFTLAFLMILSIPLAPLWDYSVKAEGQEKEEVITLSQKVITTQTTFQKPVAGIISQGYHWYHQAVDIADNEGQKIKAVATGRVIEIGYQFWGYGNYIIIEHGENFSSVYAHLEKINVAVGQEVEKETILGTVGSTGRSTGPHLHLEIKEDSKNLNPFSVIKEL